jgi:benzoate/toluate 1,2-dioxygenase beta subunit
MEGVYDRGGGLMSVQEMTAKESYPEPDIRDIERTLYREASLLDKADIEGWLEMYTDDATYWMPVLEDQEDPLNHISLFYDDRVMMEIRVLNYTHPNATSKEHKFRSSHLVGNVVIEDHEPVKGVVKVSSNFQVMIYYREEKRMYAGTYQHELQQVEDGIKIRHKRVNLIDCDGVHKTFTMYL